MNLPNKKLTVIGILIILILIIALIIPLVLLKSGKSKDDYNAAGRNELVSINNVINATENHVNGLIEKATTEKRKKRRRSADYNVIKNEVQILEKSLKDLDRTLSSTSFQSAVGECQKILASVKLVLDNIKQNQFNITCQSYDQLSKQESLLRECDTTLETIKTISLDDVEVAKELVNNIDDVMNLSKVIIKETPKPIENISKAEKPKNYTVSNNQTTPSVLINSEINGTKSKNKTNNDKTPAVINSETDDKKSKNEAHKDSSSVMIKPEIQDNKSKNKTNEDLDPSIQAKAENSEEKSNSLIKSENKTEVKQEKTSGVTIKTDKANKDEALVTVTTPTISDKKKESESKAIITGNNYSKVAIEPKIESVETTTKPQTSKTTTKEIVITTKTTTEQNIETTLTTTKPLMKITIGTSSTEDKLKETEERKASTDEIVEESADKVEENKIKELVKQKELVNYINDQLEENKIEEIVSPPLVKQSENKQNEDRNDLEKTAKISRDEELKGNLPVGAHSSIV